MSAKQQNVSKSLADALWRQYGTALHRYLARCIRRSNVQDARDLAQEVYLRLLRKEKGEAISNYQAYVYRIASNVAYEFRMRTDREREFLDFDSAAVDQWAESTVQPLADPIGDALSNERTIDDALARLPLIERQVFLMQKRDGLAYTEIAQRLGTSANMVHKHLKRALATLRTNQQEL